MALVTQLMAWTRFARRRQRPTESLEEFADDLRKLGRRAGRSDLDMHGQFLGGMLDQEIQANVLKADMKSFAEAVRTAKHFHAVHRDAEEMQSCQASDSSGRHENKESSNGSQGALEAEIWRLENRIAELQLPAASNPVSISRDILSPRLAAMTCFVCGGKDTWRVTVLNVQGRKLMFSRQTKVLPTTCHSRKMIC
ncbi:hypothetical protein M514_07950 [Trichuris suis]|uniref:Uncharacterized protein n=1 Tax=Trichuris suis TaxID=68888 RepID=A0A085NIW8_9BILA|nr:hypothetical protein M514_07950 [Trichuris suis]